VGTLHRRLESKVKSFADFSARLFSSPFYVVDKKGIVRLAYRGTFWGDRPSIEETLEMIRNEDFSFKHPKRLKLK